MQLCTTCTTACHKQCTIKMNNGEPGCKGCLDKLDASCWALVHNYDLCDICERAVCGKCKQRCRDLDNSFDPKCRRLLCNGCIATLDIWSMRGLVPHMQRLGINDDSESEESEEEEVKPKPKAKGVPKGEGEGETVAKPRAKSVPKSEDEGETVAKPKAKSKPKAPAERNEDVPIPLENLSVSAPKRKPKTEGTAERTDEEAPRKPRAKKEAEGSSKPRSNRRLPNPDEQPDMLESSKNKMKEMFPDDDDQYGKPIKF